MNYSDNTNQQFPPTEVSPAAGPGYGWSRPDQPDHSDRPAAAGRHSAPEDPAHAGYQEHPGYSGYADYPAPEPDPEPTAGRWRGEPEAADAQRAPSSPSVSLLLQDGSSRSYHVHEGSNIIGRSNTADLRLPDTGVSREHAEITWDGTDAVLTDLKSTNGTTVNETPVENWLLADGDVITMGHSHIEVHIIRPQNH